MIILKSKLYIRKNCWIWEMLLLNRMFPIVGPRFMSTNQSKIIDRGSETTFQCEVNKLSKHYLI
ncbi:unnamed protein product [Meloidogyne enterolobii]|uniref:Uncharacterized protein n=1 Tax=Meloidogyne enterolobii TaxID=390850 RepID=A0ACB0Y6H8_MELEN